MKGLRFWTGVGEELGVCSTGSAESAGQLALLRVVAAESVLPSSRLLCARLLCPKSLVSGGAFVGNSGEEAIAG